MKNRQNPIALVQDYYKIGILVMSRPNLGEACFCCIFRDLRRFYFLDIQKLKNAAAYFAYTQARPWELPFKSPSAFRIACRIILFPYTQSNDNLIVLNTFVTFHKVVCARCGRPTNCIDS